MVCANFNHGYLQCVMYCLWRLVLAVYDVLTGKVVRNLEGGHKSCVRDISWHPYQHTIISSSVSVCVRAHHAMGTHENSSWNKKSLWVKHTTDTAGQNANSSSCLSAALHRQLSVFWKEAVGITKCVADNKEKSNEHQQQSDSPPLSKPT